MTAFCHGLVGVKFVTIRSISGTLRPMTDDNVLSSHLVQAHFQFNEAVASGGGLEAGDEAALRVLHGQHAAEELRVHHGHGAAGQLGHQGLLEPRQLRRRRFVGLQAQGQTPGVLAVICGGVPQDPDPIALPDRRAPRKKKMPPAERTFSPMMGGKLPGGLGNARAMAPPRHFCGQPTPEGPCDKLGLRRGRCWDHGGGPPRCLHPTPDGPCQKFRQYGGVVLACVEHGGGRRCTYPDCNSNVAKGPLCVTHTNCKTCQADGCETFIQINSVMRQGHSWMCHHPGCKASRASGSFCTRHAGDRVARCRPMSEIRSMWWQMPSARRWSSLSAPDTQWPVSTVHTGRRRGPGLHQARRRPALQVESVRGTHVPVFCQIQTS